MDKKIELSEDGIAAINSLVDAAEVAKTAYTKATHNFKTSYEEAAGKLGPHQTVLELVEECERLQKEINRHIDLLIPEMKKDVQRIRDFLARYS